VKRAGAEARTRKHDRTAPPARYTKTSDVSQRQPSAWREVGGCQAIEIPINRNRAHSTGGGCEPEHGDHRCVARASGGQSLAGIAQQNSIIAAVRAGRRRAGMGPHQRDCRASLLGVLTLPKKITPYADIIPTRQGSLIGLIVFLSGLPSFFCNKKGSFSSFATPISAGIGTYQFP